MMGGVVAMTILEHHRVRISPSLKPTQLPFQFALLRATELAQKLLIG